MIYTVDLGSTDRADWLCNHPDLLGNDAGPENLGNGVISLRERTVRFLHGFAPVTDGHLDYDGNIWISGTAHPVHVETWPRPNYNHLTGSYEPEAGQTTDYEAVQIIRAVVTRGGTDTDRTPNPDRYAKARELWATLTPERLAAATLPAAGVCWTAVNPEADAVYVGEDPDTPTVPIGTVAGRAAGRAVPMAIAWIANKHGLQAP